jgi:acyl carrier protein
MDEFLTKVQQAFHDAFDVDPQLVSVNTGPDDIPGWDSAGHLGLVSSLESTFGVSFDVDDLMEMENVREIVRILQSKLNRA